jgi:hypothetical protein
MNMIAILSRSGKQRLWGVIGSVIAVAMTAALLTLLYAFCGELYTAASTGYLTELV